MFQQNSTNSPQCRENKKRSRPKSAPLNVLILLAFVLLEVSVKEALEGSAVTGLVLCHLVDGVVDGVEVQLLCHLSQLELAFASAVLGGNASFEVLLGGGKNDLAQQLGKLGGVLRFLVSCLFPVHTDLGVALAESHSRHSEVHTDLAAFAVEVGAQTLYDLGGNVGFLGNAYYVLGSEGTKVLLLLDDLNEFLGGLLAQGASGRGILAYYDLTAYGTFPFFHCLLLLFMFEIFNQIVSGVSPLRDYCSIKFRQKM